MTPAEKSLKKPGIMSFGVLNLYNNNEIPSLSQFHAVSQHPLLALSRPNVISPTHVEKPSRSTPLFADRLGTTSLQEEYGIHEATHRDCDIHGCHMRPHLMVSHTGTTRSLRTKTPSTVRSIIFTPLCCLLPA